MGFKNVTRLEGGIVSYSKFTKERGLKSKFKVCWRVMTDTLERLLFCFPAFLFIVIVPFILRYLCVFQWWLCVFGSCFILPFTR